MADKVRESITMLTSIIEDTKKHVGSIPANEGEENEDPQHFQALVAEAYMQMYGHPVPQEFVSDNLFWLEGTMLQLRAFLAMAEGNPEVVTDEANLKIDNITEDISRQRAEMSVEYPRFPLRIAMVVMRKMAKKIIRRVAHRVSQKP